METKKHLKAQKKVVGAVSTFEKAVNELDAAINLIEESVKVDVGRLTAIEDQIKSLEQAHDEVQSNIISKQGEIQKHIGLSLRLKEFTV